MKKTNRLGIAGLALIAGTVWGSVAAAGEVFFQGFESDSVGWSANATRVASGTNGITSATGGFHAQAIAGAFTQWGGYSSVFPVGGYKTELDIFLNVGTTAANDTRFDWTSAINNSANAHRRDFAFNGGFYNDSDVTGTGARFVFSASNSTGRTNSFPKNPGRDPFAITTTGWYTFEHEFYDNGGVLAVDLSILDSADTELHSWTLSDPTDLMGIIGGNRYGWLANNEFAFLAIDNSRLSTPDAVAVPEPASLALLGIACAAFAGMRRRKRS